MNKRTALVTAIILIAVNTFVRLVLRIIAPDEQNEVIPGLITHGAMVLTAFFIALWRARHILVSKVIGEMIVSTLIVAVIVSLIGPLISGGSFWAGGWRSMGFRMIGAELTLMLGVGLGVLVAIALGLDPRSRAWQRVRVMRR